MSGGVQPTPAWEKAKSTIGRSEGTIITEIDSWIRKIKSNNMQYEGHQQGGATSIIKRRGINNNSGDSGGTGGCSCKKQQTAQFRTTFKMPPLTMMWHGERLFLILFYHYFLINWIYYH